MIGELRARDPLLFWTGAAMLLALLVVTLISRYKAARCSRYSFLSSFVRLLRSTHELLRR